MTMSLALDQTQFADEIRAANVAVLQRRFKEVTPELSFSLGMLSRMLQQTSSDQAATSIGAKLEAAATNLKSEDASASARVDQVIDALTEMFQSSSALGVIKAHAAESHIRSATYCLLRVAEMSLADGLRSRVIRLAQNVKRAIGT